MIRKSGTYQRGISQIEFGVVAALFAILVGTFLNSVRIQQEQAEKFSMELTIMYMRTGLLSELADRLIKNRGREADDLVGANPVRWLKSPPPGYLGEFKELNEREVKGGSWYFDQSTGEMVYKVNIDSHFRRLDGSSRNEVRWRVQGRDHGRKSGVENLALLPVTPYEWF